MTEVLQEYVDSRGVTLRVDRGAGVLRGVKLIGLESLNGRRYRPSALAEAIGLYEGAKVNVNHSKEGPLAPRDYRDRLGVIRQVEFRAGEGLFGNLHFNPKHALAEQLAWDAENNPRNVGFSHNVLARLTREGDETVVEAIARVQSVDLVADPAATQGLFEERRAETALPSIAWAAISLEALRAQRPDLLEQYATEELQQARASLADAAQREARLTRRLRIVELLESRGMALGENHDERLGPVGSAFIDALMAAADDEQLEALVIERAGALRQARERRGLDQASADKPRSSEQWAALVRQTKAPTTARDFARAIRG